MTKKRVIISVITLLVIIGGLFYYNNSQKKILFEDITSDNVEKFGTFDCGFTSETVSDSKQIEGILEYIHSLKIKPTDENAPNDTPDGDIVFICKDGNNVRMDIYGEEIVFLYPKDRYPGKYRLYGFDYDDLHEVCEKLGINPVK